MFIQKVNYVLSAEVKEIVCILVSTTHTDLSNDIILHICIAVIIPFMIRNHLPLMSSF